jgi:hypothetical protein
MIEETSTSLSTSPPLSPSDSALRKAGVTWQTDLHFINSTTPHTRGLSPRVLQAGERRYESLVRCSRHGLTCYSGSWGFLAAGSTQIQALAKPRLRLPGLFAWARALAEDHDMEMAFSAAGHRVEILRRMWGSRATLALDWAGSLRPMFLAFQAEARRTRDAFPEGGGLVFSSREAVLSFDGMMRGNRRNHSCRHQRAPFRYRPTLPPRGPAARTGSELRTV